jgi:multidrug efflux pump subunit AcrA (membrane-fusion protein)
MEMNKLPVCFALCMALLLNGCKQTQEAPKEKPPRPVEVATLTMQAPSDRRIVTASAASWKSEQIGFEISGRIEWVIEPNANVEGHIVDSNNVVVIPGEPIARIKSEKYRLQVEQAKAELSRAEQSVAAAETELEKSFPAQFKAAEADLKLAEVDRDRRNRLVQRNAGAQADADKAEANYQNALSKIEQLKSTQKAKEAELKSIKLQVDIADQAVQEAQRNLANCELYSSFRGQIADVSVVPGSFVGAGNPVATVQMMNPIKVEFEVSADDSRLLRNRQNVPVFISGENGTKKPDVGYLYQIDSTADPATRTFTVTVLIKNENVADRSDSSTNSPSIPSVVDVWPMKYDFLPGETAGMNFIAEDAILDDELGSYVWKVDNLQMGDIFPDDRLLTVSKLRIEKESLQLPFLGSWLFRQIKVMDDSIDLKRAFVAGKLSLSPEQAKQFNGNQVRIEAKRQWAIRPGDIVQVDLSQQESAEGLFVPMDAVIHQGDRTFLAVVSGSGNDATVNRVEVVLLPTKSGESTSSVRQIRPASKEPIVGKRYVTKGAHFLIEGQQVTVVKAASLPPHD